MNQNLYLMISANTIAGYAKRVGYKLVGNPSKWIVFDPDNRVGDPFEYYLNNTYIYSMNTDKRWVIL